jgi:hypothetical protein
MLPITHFLFSRNSYALWGLIFCSRVRTAHCYRPLGKRHVQEMWAGGIIPLPYILSMPSSGWALNRDLRLCMVRTGRQEALSRCSSGSGISAGVLCRPLARLEVRWGPSSAWGHCIIVQRSLEVSYYWWWRVLVVRAKLIIGWRWKW